MPETAKLSAPAGLEGVRVKVRQYFRWAREVRPIVRRYAEEITQGLEPRDTYGLMRALYNFVRDKVDYRSDPGGIRGSIEYTKAPWIMLEEIEKRGLSAGDCDDHAALLVGLLYSIGIPAGVMVTWAPGNESKEPDHIYAVGFDSIRGRWIALDAVNKSDPIAWERPFRESRRFILK